MAGHRPIEAGEDVSVRTTLQVEEMWGVTASSFIRAMNLI